MPSYQITILPKDEVYLPAINRLVGRSNGAYYTVETKNGLLYALSFPSIEMLESFKEAVTRRLSKRIC